MKKHKKAKLICSKCHSETVKKLTKACKKCPNKSGKTINCSVCKEYYHQKCISTKSKRYFQF